MSYKLTVNNFIDEIFNNIRFKISCISTIILCMIAHAYSYFNATLIHDRCTYFMDPALNGAIRAKWLANYVDILTGFAYVPWLSGVLTIVFLLISVYLIVEILDIRKAWSIILVAGLCVTNYSVLGAHLYWPHEILAALPMACISAWIWTKRECKTVIRILGELIFVGFSLAIYGAYTPVAPALVLLVCLTELLKGEDWKKIIFKGIEYVISFLLGVGFYYLVQRFFVFIQRIEMYSYAGEEKLMNLSEISFIEILDLVQIAYKNSVKYLCGIYDSLGQNMQNGFAIAILFLGICLFFYLLKHARRQKIEMASYILIFALIAVAPICLGLIYVFSFNSVHFLMVFPYVMFYIYLVKLAEDVIDFIISDGSKTYLKIIPIMLVALMSVSIYRNILVCNMAYTRLENSFTVSKSIANRLLDRIENCDGFEGDETVVFVGSIKQSEYFCSSVYSEKGHLSVLDNVGPADRRNVHGFTYDSVLYNILSNVLGSNLKFEQYTEKRYNSDENKCINDLEIFPADGSVVKIEDTIVVKLSE